MNYRDVLLCVIVFTNAGCLKVNLAVTTSVHILPIHYSPVFPPFNVTSYASDSITKYTINKDYIPTFDIPMVSF
jgi:hypothetical protein